MKLALCGKKLEEHHGAVEARRAHNPEVGGSKLPDAMFFFSFPYYIGIMLGCNTFPYIKECSIAFRHSGISSWAREIMDRVMDESTWQPLTTFGNSLSINAQNNMGNCDPCLAPLRI
jgi:hypothetical protein